MLSPNLILALVLFAASADPSDPAPVLSLEDKPVMHEWVGGVNASAIFTDGNTETRSANAAFDAQYRREKDRTTFGAFWNYQDDRTGVLQRRTGAKAQYDYFFMEKTYGFVQTSIENDMQADLARRWILSVGAGRQLIENAVHKFSAELGLAWFDEHFNNSTDHDFFAARGAYKWDWIINKAWTFFHGAEIYPSLEDEEDVYAKVDTRLKVILSEKMFAQGQWVMDWDNSPAAGKESVDNRYILSIGWSF